MEDFEEVQTETKPDDTVLREFDWNNNRGEHI